MWDMLIVCEREDTGNEIMYDTIAAFCEPSVLLPDSVFQGGTLVYNFSSSAVVARLWHNPQDDAYAPRITYWRNAGTRERGSRELSPPVDDPPEVEDIGPNGLLKIEFSIPKMFSVGRGSDVLLRNLEQAEVEHTLDLVDAWLAHQIADLPPLRAWRIQRVDYCHMWDVGALLPAYMSVLAKLRISSWSRHPYDQSEGVVWKTKSTKGRWVKFYNKSREMGVKLPAAAVLRFEVSNYRDAVKYMCERWFGCERNVGEVVQPARAVFAMSVMWDRLGLGLADSYGHEERELSHLLDVFGQERVAQAWYVLRLVRKYGNAAWQEPLSLVSKAKFYRYRSELCDAGLLCVVDEKVVSQKREALPALHLPVATIFARVEKPEWGENLKNEKTNIAGGRKKFCWDFLTSHFCLTAKKPSNYLVGRLEAWIDGTEADELERVPFARGNAARIGGVSSGAAGGVERGGKRSRSRKSNRHALNGSPSAVDLPGRLGGSER